MLIPQENIAVCCYHRRISSMLIPLEKIVHLLELTVLFITIYHPMFAPYIGCTKVIENSMYLQQSLTR